MLKKAAVIVTLLALAAASVYIMRERRAALRFADGHNMAEQEINAPSEASGSENESSDNEHAANEYVENVPEMSSDQSAGIELEEEPENGNSADGYEEAETPEIIAESDAPRGLLLPNEAVVTNYSELKDALSRDNGITDIYFGNNITMQIGGIKIHSSKHSTVISGLNPLEPEQVEPYTLTDYSSASFFDTIYIDSSGISKLTVRDLSITGKNYYGPFSVYDAGSFSDVSLIYERVNYNGPQFIYHRTGTVRVKDCAVRIHGGNGGSANQEFSEAKHLEFHGANTIMTDTSSYTVFWHPLGGTFTVADDASLVLTSPNTSTAFGVFYADAAAYSLDIKIGRRAVFDITTSGIVTPDLYVTLKSFSVLEAGSFYLTTTKAAAGTVMKTAGALTVEKEAKFIVSGYGGSSYTLLRQESGDITVMKDAVFQITAGTAYSALINLVGRAFKCEDPAGILLYNAGRPVLATTNPGRVIVNAQQINYWNTLSSGGLDSPPLYRWDKPDGTNFLLDGTLTAGSGGNFSAITSNYVQGDPPGSAPDAQTFSMINARVLAFGRLELSVIPPDVKSTFISGVTKPGSAVRASFTQQGADYVYPDVIADSSGIFHIPIDVELNKDTLITVKSNRQYLTSFAETIVRGEGAVDFLVPDYLDFFVTEISPTVKTVKRLHPEWEIVVSDERGAGKKWSLYARLEGELTPDNPNLPPLEGAVVYTVKPGGTTVMSTDSDVLIAEHTAEYDEEVFPVIWDEDEGILLSIKPGTAFTGTVYTAGISWTLVTAP